MSNLKAVLFDLDGVLVDTSHYHYLAWKRLVEHLEIHGFDDEVNERLKGVSREESVNIILSLTNKEYSDEAKIELGLLKNKWYLDYLSKLDSNDVLPNMYGLLKELKAKGIRIGLVSASKNAGYILDKVGLTSYFEVGIYGQKNKAIKPNPEFFLSCAEELEAEPSACIVIEDARSGIEGAKKAGMKVLGIGSPKNVGNADLVVESTDEISFDLIKSIT